MKVHFVYKITNTVNNKIYIGKHSTNNIDDAFIKGYEMCFNNWARPVVCVCTKCGNVLNGVGKKPIDIDTFNTRYIQM